MCDGLLRLNLSERVKIINFSDDIALTIVGKTIDETSCKDKYPRGEIMAECYGSFVS